MSDSIELNDLSSGTKNFNSYQHFQEFIEQYKEDIIIAKFYRSNCPFCKEYTPIFEKLKQFYTENFHFTNVNVEGDILFSYKYKISDLPTTVIIKEGVPYYRRIGVLTHLELKERLDKLQSAYREDVIEAQAKVK